MSGSHTFYRHPDLPYLELRHGHDSNACYATHTHAEYSIGTVLKGQSNYQFLQQEFTLSQSNSVFIPKNIPHSCNPDKKLHQGRWDYLMLYIKPDYWEKLTSDWQIHETRPNKGNPIICESLHKSIIKLHYVWHHYPSDSKSIEIAWLACFNQLIEYFEKNENIPTAEQNSKHLSKQNDTIITDTLKWLNKNTQEPFTFNDLTEATGYKRYQIQREFRKKLGISPYQFVLNKRIENSKELLKTGESLSNTAYQLGFSDQAHFQRTFKRYTAITPKQYQQS